LFFISYVFKLGRGELIRSKKTSLSVMVPWKRPWNFRGDATNIMVIEKEADWNSTQRCLVTHLPAGCCVLDGWFNTASRPGP
jgi:hypothetical protein